MKERLIRQRELTARLNTYRDEYYNQNAPSVSDAVYDRLFDELTELEEETGVVMSNSPTQTVGYPVVSRLPQAKHDIPLLSLDKTKLISELLAFQDGRTVDFSLKLDGLTTEIIYEGGLLQRLSTRGDGDIGEDITHNAEAIEGIPVQIPYKERLVVAGESFIHCNDFERLRQKLVDSTGKPYRNSRNLAAGSVRAYNSAVCAKRCVHFLPFAVIEGLPEIEAETDSKRMKLAKLTEFGFGRVRSIQFATANNDMMDLHIKVLRDKAAEEDLPIDGLVMTYDSISYSRTCGRTGHHFKDGLAFKFEDELFETRLDHIEWTPTRSGEISPVAVFDTVEIDGCEVSRATLHNLSFIEGLELMPGNRILVSKRNMIIPQVEENLDRGDFSMEVLVPSLCPCCGYQTMIHTTQKRTDGEQKLTKTLFCHNPNCASQNLRKFVHFVGKKAMDIDGLSEATLEQFIARGWLQDFTDIYRLDNHRDEIIRMDGFGERSWQRLWDAIQKSRNTTFERYLIAADQIKEPHQKVDHCCLTGTCRTDDSDFLPRLDVSRKIFDNDFVRIIRIAEANMVEFDLAMHLGQFLGLIAFIRKFFLLQEVEYPISGGSCRLHLRHTLCQCAERGGKQADKHDKCRDYAKGDLPIHNQSRTDHTDRYITEIADHIHQRLHNAG